MVEIAYRSVWDVEKWIEELGLKASSIHSSDQCDGESCSIHNPSKHHMRLWPMPSWR